MWSAADRAKFSAAVRRRLRRAPRTATRGAAASDGFTLIEVVVAIAVLALVLGAIGGAVGTTVKGLRSVDRQLPLLETAQGLLAALPDRTALRPGARSGTIGAVHWRIDVAPLNGAVAADTGGGAGAPQSAKWMPLLVTVSVQGGDGPPVRLDTIRLAPRPASRPAS
jgi:general secretion pathway protein I